MIPQTIEWNMNKNFFDELHVVRMTKINAFASGDYNTYVDMLDEIYNMVSFKFKPKQKEELISLFGEIERYDDLRENIRMGLYNIDDLRSYKTLLRKIDMKIMQYMHEAKMILPKSFYVDPMEEHKKEYGVSKKQ